MTRKSSHGFADAAILTARTERNPVTDYPNLRLEISVMPKKTEPQIFLVVDGDVRRLFFSIEEATDWLRDMYECEAQWRLQITIDSLESPRG